jgi:hypothetical protein
MVAEITQAKNKYRPAPQKRRQLAGSSPNWVPMEKKPGYEWNNGSGGVGKGNFDGLRYSLDWCGSEWEKEGGW